MPADVIEERSSTDFTNIDSAGSSRTTGQPPIGAKAAKARLFGHGLARSCRQGLVVALGACMLLWIGLINGRPSVFADTALYYSQAEYLADAVGLVAPADDRVAPGDPTALPAHPGAPNVSVTIDGGRSPIYGLLLYGLQRVGGLWLVAAAQAAIVAVALYLLFRAAVPVIGDVGYLIWMAAISAVTSAPAFTSFIMPDVLGGVAGLTGLVILVYGDRLATPSRLAVWALLVFSLSVHRANILALAALTIAGAIWLMWVGLPRPRIAKRALALIGAALAAWALVAATFAPIDHRAGETVRDPPFLMARILADGPGRRYLQYACAHAEPLALCRFRNLPQEDSDTLLWSRLPGRGLFGVSDYATRLKLEAQEHGFVLGALAYAPLDELGVSALNTLRQLGMSHVQSPFADPARFIDDGYWRRTSLMRIIPGAQGCRSWGRCASRISQPVLSEIDDAALVVSMLALAGFAVWLGAKPRPASGRPAALDDEDRRLLGLILLCGAFVLANAAVCGALSAPVPRYQARLIWMIPAIAMLVGGALASRWRSPTHQADHAGENRQDFPPHSRAAT